MLSFEHKVFTMNENRKDAIREFEPGPSCSAIRRANHCAIRAPNFDSVRKAISTEN
jgi:hypothetical protein